MAATQELLLGLLGDEEDDGASLFLNQVLNRGMESIPDVIQTGIKSGQTLKAHIQNVICFSYQLAKILALSDSDIVNLIAAAYTHDLNKFPEYNGKAYSSIATVENIRQILEKMLLECEYDFEIDIDLVVSIIRGHSSHLHCDGDGLFARQKSTSRDTLVAAIQTADTLDLSHHFHEKDQKEKSLRILNGQLKDIQFEYTWHYFSDNRGVYTNLIHNTVVALFKQQGAVPLLFYPEGVWYLIPKGMQIHISPTEVTTALQNKIDEMSLRDSSKLLQEAKGVGFKFTQNPFSLGLTPEKIISLLVQAILGADDRKYVDKYEKLLLESPLKCFKEYTKWMKKSDERTKKLNETKINLESMLIPTGIGHDFSVSDENFQKLPQKKKEKIIKSRLQFDNALRDIDIEKKFVGNPLWQSEPQHLFSPELEIMRSGKLVGSLPYLLIEHLGFDSGTAWNCAAEQAGISWEKFPELMFFNPQSDRGYRIAVLLYENGIDFELIVKRYTHFITSLNQHESANCKETQIDQEIGNYIAAYLKIKDGNIEPDKGTLKKYIESNHEQCCHCSGGSGEEWMAGNIPRGIKSQLFSNRLKGGGGEPKRNVCKICWQSFLVEKLIYETYDNHFYLHLFADGGEYSSHAEPGVFLESLKKGIMNLQGTDCRSFFIQPGATIKDCLKGKIPKILGEPKKKNGMLIPKFSESMCGQVSIGINSPGDNNSTRFVFALFHLLVITTRFNLRGIMSKSSIPPLKADEFNTLYVDHIPLCFKALLPENNLDAEKTRQLWTKFKSLYGLRNTYNAMEDDEISNIANTLFDKTGLDLFYYIHKSFSKSKQTKEYKPWKQAWPYLQQFIQEDKLMPIKKLAEIALQHHFHGQSWKETSQAKPLDLAFDALSKYGQPETEEDLKMVMLHDVSRGLERLSMYENLGKEKYAAVKEFIGIFFEQIFQDRYKADKNKMIKDQKRIRAAFLGYLTVLRDNVKAEKERGKQ